MVARMRFSSIMRWNCLTGPIRNRVLITLTTLPTLQEQEVGAVTYRGRQWRGKAQCLSVAVDWCPGTRQQVPPARREGRGYGLQSRVYESARLEPLPVLIQHANPARQDVGQELNIAG